VDLAERDNDGSHCFPVLQLLFPLFSVQYRSTDTNLSTSVSRKIGQMCKHETDVNVKPGWH
jgi:hypothetical protein